MPLTSPRRVAHVLGVVAAVWPLGAHAQDEPAATRYDVLIRNARIVDGTGNAWFRGDVAVQGDKIAAVGAVPATATAARTIDATGLVVAPGFIDVHTHADAEILNHPKAENFVRDGVTTIVSGNCGGSARDVGQLFSRMRAKGAAVNMATLVGHNTVLRAVKGDRKGALTPEQMNEAKEIVRKAMQDGAVGFSTGLIYLPGTYSDTEEIIELAKVAGEFGGIYATHMRSEGAGIMDAIDEALRVGREANCRVQISHFKLPADVSKKLGGSDATLARVMAARAAGQEVWLDQYPYTASSTGITVLLPDWVLERGGDEAKRLLADPKQLDKVVAEMVRTAEKRGRKNMAYVVIASCRAFPQYNGRNLLEVAQMRKLKETNGGDVELLGLKSQDRPPVNMEDQVRAAIAIYQAGGASCIFHTMDEADVSNILRHPLVAVASDSGIRVHGSGQPHPRGYGTNARVLGRYVRELKLLTLEDAVRKMTSLPATAFRFTDRGLVREGFAADLTIFDPAKVTDKATFDDPHHYAEGITAVLVNGQVVFADGQMTGTLPSQPLLGPGVKQ
jgi:N-acyl-D-amino-acid deacylase